MCLPGGWEDHVLHPEQVLTVEHSSELLFSIHRLCWGTRSATGSKSHKFHVVDTTSQFFKFPQPFGKLP